MGGYGVTVVIGNWDTRVCYGLINLKINHFVFRLRRCSISNFWRNCWFSDWWIWKPNFYYGLMDLEFIFTSKFWNLEILRIQKSRNILWIHKSKNTLRIQNSGRQLQILQSGRFVDSPIQNLCGFSVPKC